ncbi:MAG: hypothetical protein CMP83_08445 [Gammaproteobacteria bacterium]|nr:hypothetical protein [Gammaproteobacteria bacterium]
MYDLVTMIPCNEHAAFLLYVLKRPKRSDKLKELGLPPGWMAGHYKGAHYLKEYYYREEDGEEVESYEDLYVPWVLYSVSLQGEARSTLWWNREWDEEQKDLEKSAKKPKLDQDNTLMDLGDLVVDVLREAGIQGHLDAQTCNEHIDSLQEQLNPYIFTHDGTVQDYIVALEANRTLATKEQRRAYGTALLILGAVCCGHLVVSKADNLRKNHAEMFFFEHLCTIVAEIYNFSSSDQGGSSRMHHEATRAIEDLEVALNRREPRPAGVKG